MRIQRSTGLPVALLSFSLLSGCGGGGGGGGDDDGALTLDIAGFTLEGENEQGYLEYRHQQTGIVFVKLPGGTFTMGSPSDEEGRHDDEGPTHDVTLSPFLIAKYEVSVEEWDTVNEVFGDVTKYPKTDVGWYACQDFCNKTGLDLPSEAQWEYACRAGTSGPHAGSGRIYSIGWVYHSSNGEVHLRGVLDPNAFGLFDMHGNVWEWCEDVYGSGFYSDPQSRAVDPINGWREDPFGPSSGNDSAWVIRGGCFMCDEDDCRSATRGSWMVGGDRTIGFRPVHDPSR